MVLLAQIIWSGGRPVEFLLDILQILLDVQQDSTGCLLEFCKFASNVLELPISLRNEIKNFYWMSSKISSGCPLKSAGRLGSRIALLDVPQSRRFDGLSLHQVFTIQALYTTKFVTLCIIMCCILSHTISCVRSYASAPIA